MPIRPRFRMFGREVAADTLALLIYSVVVGVTTTLAIDIWFVGMTGMQWTGVRLVYGPLRFILARLLGKMTDRLRTYFAGPSPNRLQKAVVDAMSLYIYQQPLYVVCALIVGVELPQLYGAAILYFIEALLTGWFYGVVLDFVRRRLGEPTT